MTAGGGTWEDAAQGRSRAAPHGSSDPPALGAPMGVLDLLEDACDRLPHTTRGMFGGHGLFAPNGGMFAGVMEDGIILKLADEGPRAELVALGGAPWSYAPNMTMKEWILVPDAFYDDPRTLAEWAARAHRLAPPRKEKAAKKGAKKPAKKPVKKAAKAAERSQKRSKRSAKKSSRHR